MVGFAFGDQMVPSVKGYLKINMIKHPDNSETAIFFFLKSRLAIFKRRLQLNVNLATTVRIGSGYFLVCYMAGVKKI
jgi:hypothetical protein